MPAALLPFATLAALRPAARRLVARAIVRTQAPPPVLETERERWDRALDETIAGWVEEDLASAADGDCPC